MVFKTIKGKLLYRIGDVIISTNSENPSQWYGGKWELFAPGRTLVCIDTSQSEFNSIKKIGGSKTHSLSQSQLPNIKGGFGVDVVAYYQNFVSGVFKAIGNIGQSATAKNDIPNDAVYGIEFDVGNNEPHNNLQPFITVYIWTRIS